MALLGCRATQWVLSFVLLVLPRVILAGDGLAILKADTFAPYIARFNSMEDENVTNSVPNSSSWAWLSGNIPFFECPDRETEEIYYFRWWSFRKHLVKTPHGFVFTEFLTPVRHAGQFNTISCAAGFHIAEGRWLRDQQYLDDYINFWVRGNDGKPQPHFHDYSSWFASAVYDRYLVNQDRNFVTRLLNELVADYRLWEQQRRLTNGLFWQFDVRDGMEESISGSRTSKNCRPTLNSYMFANARSIAELARLANRKTLAAEFEQKAAEIKRLTQAYLWDSQANFFEVRRPDGQFAGVREELGYIPWWFDLPDRGYESAWSQLTDPQGFRSPYGITTAERRHLQFRSHGCCKCEWDGAIWPFATSQTLGGLANVLRDYPQSPLSSKDYMDAFASYVRCHRRDGKPYLGQYLDETTGQWLQGGERSRYYNHSTFADLLITGVVGLRPRADDTLVIHPLVHENLWPWFCLDGLHYHHRILTILWDKDGKHYSRGPGLTVLVGGKKVAQTDQLAKITAKLP